jgi:hypothetical protein
MQKGQESPQNSQASNAPPLLRRGDRASRFPRVPAVKDEESAQINPAYTRHKAAANPYDPPLEKPIPKANPIETVITQVIYRPRPSFRATSLPATLVAVPTRPRHMVIIAGVKISPPDPV